ncbi:MULTISPECIES: glutaredoxin family protein [unclassified Cyanobium]|uniref:glutaredoxin family protein n=1 Tax=unclassified Cyanobium TaxID=2627006 RepID=UPI0020CDCE7A|nr:MULTISPECIES: glutaredoxin family protein [unclassified Cyanobium]MCP9860847.1 glutaredoxin family protein [Cyanobium sp. Cruz-8H5]MCP9868089.1 glutaredoxin family protein [Cyanobium sp. Cruz-8D1]
MGTATAATRRWRQGLLALALAALLSLVSPAAAAAGELQVFVREGCPHCAAAKAFLPELQRQRPAVQVRLRDVGIDPQARDDLLRLSQQAGIQAPGVPAFAYAGRLLVGFDDAGGRGQDLLALVAAPSPDNPGEGAAGAAGLSLGPLGRLSVDGLGLPLFTLAMGLLDGFNPCAMWVLLFLLSLLVHWQNRRRMALVAGTFVLVSGAVYYAFMAAWLNVFLLLGWSTGLRLVLAGLAITVGVVNVLDSRRQGSGFSLSIPASAKPGLYARLRNVVQSRSLLPALAAVAVLAVVVNAVELLCTAGLPAIYTAVLSQQNLPASAHYAYLGLYILGYIADDSLMVAAAVLALSSNKLTEAGGRWLKLISGAVMLALGLALLLRPGWLL